MSASPSPLIEPWFSLHGAAIGAGAEVEGEQLDLLLAGVERAVGRGCERVWLEGLDGLAQSSDSLRLALWVAGQIDSVRIVATGIRLVEAPSNDVERSWIRLAEDAATADGLCGGRLELAFAEVDAAKAGLAGTVARLREAWSGGRVSLGDGGDPIEIHPRPCRPDGPKLWARVSSREAVDEAVAAELGAIVSLPGLAREGQESVFLTGVAAGPETEGQPLIALRHLVPAGDEGELASAWLESLESSLVRPT